MPSSPLHRRPSPRRPTFGRDSPGADRGGQAPPPRPPSGAQTHEPGHRPLPDRWPGYPLPPTSSRPPSRQRRIPRPVWAAAALAAVALTAFGVGRTLWNDQTESSAATEEETSPPSRSAPSRSAPEATQEPDPESAFTPSPPDDPSSDLPLLEPEPPPLPPEPSIVPSQSTVPSQESEAQSPGASEQAQTGADWNELALSIVLVSACEWGGSGSIVDDGGHVLTNAHVVQDDRSRCSDLWVAFTDSFDQEPAEWVPAQLVGVDPVHDLALLRLTERPARAREPVEIDPRRLDPGELITVLGYPGAGGMRMTLTRGVYSGVITMADGDYIKTDADLSEGNSGGAAFDSSGAFVGVPTGASVLPRVESPGVDEVGLVIPAADAERFLQRTLAAS